MEYSRRLNPCVRCPVLSYAVLSPDVRPKVTSPGEDVQVTGLNDLQRLYLLLHPQQPPGGHCRLLVLPKKHLPDTHKHERFFAFVGEYLGA
jgi:hypothetical protein